MQPLARLITPPPLVALFVALLALSVSACTAVQPMMPAAQETPPAAPSTTPGPEGSPSMPGMDMSSDAPFDAAFIDSMTEHHQGAIAMAEEVLATSERPELLALVDAIIAAQTAEITRMQEWRAAWFPDLAPTGGMGMDMGGMSVGSDDGTPFDQRFLVAMISHHQGAIEMADMALQMSERPEIRTLAEAIIAAQTAEIEQMRGWLAEWYNVTQ